MTRLGAELASRGWILRSGSSPGADSAFERGCDQAAGKKEIYLPWKGFCGSDSPLADTPVEAISVALRIHPELHARSWRIQRLRARNVCQILGPSLKTPSDLVVAWTEHGLRAGGSATVLAIAAERKIPVFNLGARELAGEQYETILARILTDGSG